MRVFRDLDLVEHLGSGVPRILRSYGKECFKFTENFLRMTFPATEQVGELVEILDKEMDRQEIQDRLGLSHRENFRSNYLKPALEQGFTEMTIPEKPNSRLQKYRLTILGKQLKTSYCRRCSSCCRRNSYGGSKKNIVFVLSIEQKFP